MTKEESHEPAVKQKLLGLIQPIVGAIIGVLFFSILFYLINSVVKSQYLFAALLSPGFLATLILAFSNDFGLNISSLGYTTILFSLSGLPYAILGSMIFSKEKATKAMGVFLLALYLVISSILGIFALAIGSIMYDH